ncbi:MAG TPA: sensor histidine kinase [Flavobacteriaceae bacterium]|nr:sensor histidine kinase [Flavobacteriaceae bacterium]
MGKAFKSGIEAKKLFLAKDSLEKVFEINLMLLDIIETQKKLEIDAREIRQELDAFASAKKNPLISAKTFGSIADKYLMNDNGPDAIYYYNRAISEYRKLKDTLRIAKIEMNKGAVHATVFKDQDSALYYYKKALPIFEERNLALLISYNHNNQARAYTDQGKYSQALEHYELAHSIELTENNASTRATYFENLKDLYIDMQDYKNAFLYAEKLKSLNDSLNSTAQNIAISDIQTKYETAKKEKANLELKTKVEKKTQAQTILWIGLSLSLIVGFVVSYLIFKNAKRKRLIAHQERELAVQKIEKNLKEQELNTIDLMISGQEKERQRLANDLHDNLGSTLATLKLNFKTLTRNFNEEEAKPILENATVLIDDAYKKVREIAHEKNSGVMAKEGLLPAVEQLARKVSNARGVKITVQGFDLKSRLESGLEITLFRIIQELITNIVKHANATEATVSMTNHRDYLNIIVEDNGKGFDLKKGIGKDGMGLSNIEKRIEHLDGTMEIDTSENKGTSIIIDLPL